MTGQATLILSSEASAAIIRNVWWGYLLAIPVMGSTAAFGSIVVADLWNGRRRV